MNPQCSRQLPGDFFNQVRQGTESGLHNGDIDLITDCGLFTYSSHLSNGRVYLLLLLNTDVTGRQKSKTPSFVKLYAFTT